MAAAKHSPLPIDLVSEAARRALEDADGDQKEATAMLEEAVRRSGKLRDALTEPLLAAACYQAVSQQIRQRRRDVWSGAKARQVAKSLPASPSDHADRVVQLAAGTLLMFPLPGGKPLGQAARAEIAEAAEYYGSVSSDMASKARWLRLIAQSIPDGRRVADVLSDKRLRELQAEAQREH